MNPPGRRFRTAEPTRCGVCGRPVELVAGNGHHALHEISDGVRSPHACPPDAVEAWRLRAAIRRIWSRAHAATTRPRPGRSPGEGVFYRETDPRED